MLTVTVWLGLGIKITWFGLWKYGLGENKCVDFVIMQLKT